MSQTLIAQIAKSLNIRESILLKVIGLFEDGATIPFIARYRKEVTGGLDEVEIAAIEKNWRQFQELIKRKEFILETIADQGQLSPDLRKQIENCWDSTLLEDLYLPYKKKRKTRGTKARDLGLEPLAKLIFEQRENNLAHICRPFINKDVTDEDTALQGARDIIAEWINENANVRNKLRSLFERNATIQSKVARGKKEEAIKYQDYYEFEQRLDRCPSHRLLAMFRAENEGLLKLNIEPDPERSLQEIERIVCKGRTATADQVFEALKDSYKRLLQPSIETEFRKKAKEIADLEAIEVFTNNLRQLLLAAPLGEDWVLGVDPGFRSGCKIVVINPQGDLVLNTTIFPHPPQTKKAESASKIQSLVHQYKVKAIAIGNGTAGRESMDFLQEIKFDHQVELFMVNESGASIYSASEIAREEFPDKDLTVRGAVSIGRRLMDPLAELVKLDPKSIGVGQYQHDVQQNLLKDSLTRTVESCVNAVGINLNTASKHLLTYVSGLGPTLAQKIVEHREIEGPFSSRIGLKKVPRLGEKAFEQCAGFLRIRNAKNPLDNTAVHPERYPLVKQMAKDLGTSIEAIIEQKELRKQISLDKYITDEVGLPTLRDILSELDKPGLDPRGAAKSFSFERNIKSIEDLKIGMRIPGLVTNVTNFGAFVDVGVKQDGLVHISQLADVFVKNPAEHVQLNQQVMVRVVEIDLKRNRIQLSMKTEG